MKWLASASLLFCISAYLPSSARSTLSEVARLASIAEQMTIWIEGARL